MQTLFSFSNVTSRCAHCVRSAQAGHGAVQRTLSSIYGNTIAHLPQQPSLSRYVAAQAAASETVPDVPMQDMEIEAVIGIETHVQLRTASKAFCNCANEYGSSPNSHVCPVCSGQPGALPVMNAESVRLAALAGLALNCKIASVSKWDRKQYFYPDLPKGYQISQYDEPICGEGHLDVTWQEEEKKGKKTVKVLHSKTIGITRAHLEEDAGKNTHGGSTGSLAGSSHSLMDLNRAGVPLLEIVTEPDFRRGIEAAAYGEELRRIVRFLGISSGNMDRGEMRCDVNVSVRPKGQEELGVKVEVKNMNSFSAMQKAIDYEVSRQSDLLRSGQGNAIITESRLYDEATQVTHSMRAKEGLADYRFFPEPDLPPIVLSDSDLEKIRATMRELPVQMRARFTSLGLPVDQVLLLAEDTIVASYFDATVAAGADPKLAGNWIQGDVMAWCNTSGVKMDAMKLSPMTLAEMIQLIENGTISGKIAKELLPDLLDGAAEAGGVAALVEERGMAQISDAAEIAAMIQKVMAENPKQLEQYRGGKVKLQGYFQGAVMKESGGRVNPAMLARVLPKQLNGE